MSVYMTRNPLNPGASNTARPGDTQWKYYSTNYTTTGIKEYIYLPDTEEIGIVLSPTGGNAQIEVCCCPPDVIEAGSGIWVLSTIIGSVSASTFGMFESPTAIRVNVTTATSCKVSVRC